MSCIDCHSALIGPSHGFTNGCKGCTARAISRGPNYHASQQQGSLTREYISELVKLDLTHSEIKQAQERDALGTKQG
jgi:hypothetical protein